MCLLEFRGLDAGALRGAIAYMREKQILHKLGVAISIAIIATACYILYHMLQGLDVDDLTRL